mmetsp:Transcript_14645/g.57482  ORF Transcript_14645/g.57482 Transcript_14645/m.57482 type:complete len:137 (+) Transcript_14645:539-949(+)
MEAMVKEDSSLLQTILWLKAKNQKFKWKIDSFVIECVALGMYWDGSCCHDFSGNTRCALDRLQTCLVAGLRHPVTGKEVVKPGSGTGWQRRLLDTAKEELRAKEELGAASRSPCSSLALSWVISRLFCCAPGRSGD